jgi:hypothetical protein
MKLRKVLAIQVDPKDDKKFNECFCADKDVHRHFERNELHKTGYTLGDVLVVFTKCFRRYMWTKTIENWLKAHEIRYWTDEVLKKSW